MSWDLLLHSLSGSQYSIVRLGSSRKWLPIVRFSLQDSATTLFHLSRRKMQMQIMKFMPWMVFANLQKGFEGFRLLLWFSTALCDDQLQPSGAVEDNTIFIVNGQGWASMWTVFYTKLIIIRPNELRRGHWRLDEVSRRVVTLSISTPIVFVILSVL